MDLDLPEKQGKKGLLKKKIAAKLKNLQKTLDRAVDNKKIFGTTFCIKYKDETWCGASGNFTADTQYFIASTTKLYVTAIILHLRSKGILDLDDKISRYIGLEILDGLHVLGGKSYSDIITIKNLLAHTSGIPDYFHQKDSEGISMMGEIIKGNDQFWTFEKMIEHSKKLKPRFVPNEKGKAYYSDTNYQLLGKIIENATGKSLKDNYEEIIFRPLGLAKTYLFEDIADMRPKRLYFMDRELFIPKAMASFRPDGGIVSVASEVMTFLEAFFNGVFFPKSYIPALRVWKRIFFPMWAGVGVHRFKLPWIYNPFGTFPEMIGHSGLSGALAFHSPEKDIYITGTVNQVAFPDTSFKLAVKLIRCIL